jgi:hypothetical protein
MGNTERSFFGLDSYVQIRACGTYRGRSQPLAPFADESRVALHVVGMLLTVAAPVVEARSVDFFLMLISSAEIIRVLGAPLLIGFALLLLATIRPTTGLLPSFEPRVGTKPATTERTSPPREHVFLLSEHLEEDKPRRQEEKRKKAKGTTETELSGKERESEVGRTRWIQKSQTMST